MPKEKFEKQPHLPIWKKLKTAFITAAVSAALIAWQTACDTENWTWKDKNAEKKEIVSKPKNDTQVNNAKFQQDETSQQDLEPEVDYQWWHEVVDTETYKDEYGRTMIKKTYKDGSRSTELKGGTIRYDYDRERDISEYEYTEFYPNGNKKFECHAAPYEWSLYAIYDENWKILYEKVVDWIRETDSASGEEDKYFKYDENGRLIEDLVDGCKYIYDDENKKVIIIHWNDIITYNMSENGNANLDDILSHKFIWETGIEIDVKNWWIEKLIKEKHLENVPYIDRYEF